jgi:putative hemolysin
MWLLYCFLIILLISLNGFFSASEIALISLRKSRVRHLVKSGHLKAIRVQKLQDDPERFLATVQIGVTLVGTMASTLGGVFAIEMLKPVLERVPQEFIRNGAEPIAVGSVVVLISYITLVAGELVPKSLAIRYAERIAFFTSAPIDALSRIFKWILRFLTVSNTLFLRIFNITVEKEASLISEDEVKFLIREGRKHGVFELSEEDLIHSVFRFTDTVVKEVMVPRTEIAAVESGSGIDAILRMMNERGFSRLPV